MTPEHRIAEAVERTALVELHRAAPGAVRERIGLACEEIDGRSFLSPPGRTASSSTAPLVSASNGAQSPAPSRVSVTDTAGPASGGSSCMFTPRPEPLIWRGRRKGPT